MGFGTKTDPHLSLFMLCVRTELSPLCLSVWTTVLQRMLISTHLLCHPIHNHPQKQFFEASVYPITFISGEVVEGNPSLHECELCGISISQVPRTKEGYLHKKGGLVSVYFLTLHLSVSFHCIYNALHLTMVCVHGIFQEEICVFIIPPGRVLDLFRDLYN